jgi:hypothetical protein
VKARESKPQSHQARQALCSLHMRPLMTLKKFPNVLIRISWILLPLAIAIPALCLRAIPLKQEVVEANKAQLKPPSDMEIYAGVESVVDLSWEELGKAYPEEMKDVKFEENRELLATILEKTGERVEAFFRDFPKTLANEQVRLERLDQLGRVEASTTHNYLYSFALDKTGALWQETRTERNGRPVDMKVIPGYFLAPGRAGLTAFVHPRYQHGSRFRYLGRQQAEAGAFVIAFAQKPEIGDYLGSYQSEIMAAPAPLLFQGVVWVHPENYQIVRMRTDLLAPRSDIGLARQTSEIWFSEVHFASITDPFWLPREVLITNKSLSLSCRNRHRYSQYQVFTVTVEEKILPIKK